MPGLTVYPTHFVAPNNHYPVDSETIGVHRVAGSWRKRKLGRFLEIKVKHLWHVVNMPFKSEKAYLTMCNYLESINYTIDHS